MGLKEIIKGIFRREKDEIEELIQPDEEVEELIDKAKEINVEKELEDPWSDFKSLCKELGSDYREVVSKAAWYYLEETGGVEVDDPISQAKELAEALEKLDDVTKKLTEPESVKSLRVYKDALKEVAELKEVMKEVKGEKITARDILPLLTKLMK